MKNYLLRIVAISWLGLLAIFTTSLQAQQSASEMKPVTSTFAITGVNVITAPGSMLEGVTVIVKDGLITHVGKGLTIPGEAEIIKGDSMYVYAGFISALSHAGIKSEDRSGNRNQGGGGNNRAQRPDVDPVNPPNNVAGILPERKVRDLIDAEEKSIEAMRSAGFTATQVVPEGGMFPGSGAVIILDGKSADEMVLKEGTAMFSQLVGGPRVYPATIIGVMAKWRELYRQATFAMQHEAAYTAQPNGTVRPDYDRSLQAFYPVIDKKQPVIIKTEKMLDSYRAMTLQKDLGFDLILGEVKEGWDLIGKIKSQNAKVILSLDLPEAEKKKEQKSEGKEAAKKPEEKEKTNSIVEKEKAELEKRKAEAIKKYCSQAAEFEKAGIAFGFATIETKPNEVLSKLRIMIEHGLSEDGALKALTTTPAEMLGVSSVMGTVEKGKMANLVISDKPIFDEKANIRYVFVDGNKFAFEVKAKKEKPAGAGATNLNLAVGTWKYTATTPDGERSGEMIIKNEGGTLTGTLTAQGAQGETELSDVTLEGNILTFSFTFGEGGESLDIDTEVKIDKDSFDGSMNVGAYGSFPVKGEKTSSPE